MRYINYYFYISVSSDIYTLPSPAVAKNSPTKKDIKQEMKNNQNTGLKDHF